MSKKDIVTHRGMVSGTGKALPDEQALKILDERVEPKKKKKQKKGKGG